MNKEYFETRFAEIEKEIEDIKINLEKYANSSKNIIEQMMATHNMWIGRREEFKHQMDICNSLSKQDNVDTA